MITKRNLVAVTQYARIHQLENRVESVFDILERILPILGQQSQGRAMINRIGIILLQENVRIVAPSCPDYSHSNGKYDFCTVGGGLPLLSQLHIKFLEMVVLDIPNAICEIVVADQEAEDIALGRKIGLTKEGFLEMIHKSILTTQNYLLDKNWVVMPMTKRFPELQSLETAIANEIVKTKSLQNQLNNDTLARSEMYRKIGVSDFHEMHQRTIRTAAQYCALAQIATRDKFLVCNHETVNLGWYNRHRTAVLHNPISVY